MRERIININIVEYTLAIIAANNIDKLPNSNNPKPTPLPAHREPLYKIPIAPYLAIWCPFSALLATHDKDAGLKGNTSEFWTGFFQHGDLLPLESVQIQTSALAVLLVETSKYIYISMLFQKTSDIG